MNDCIYLISHTQNGRCRKYCRWCDLELYNRNYDTGVKITDKRELCLTCLRYEPKHYNNIRVEVTD